MKTPPRKQLDPVTAGRVLDADLANLLKRVQAGTPLTARQRALIEERANGRTPSAITHAKSYVELASALGCTRQRLAHWTRQPDAPRPAADGRHDVGAWRRFLSAHGRLASDAGTSNASRDTRRQILEDATLGQFHAVSNALPEAIRTAVSAEGITVAAPKLRRAIFSVWLRLAQSQQAAAERQGIPGILDGDDGTTDYPPHIQALAAHVS